MNETEEASEEVYEIVAIGENTCEICSGLDGSLWPFPPTPLHPGCDCESQVVTLNPPTPRDCNDTTWSIEHVDNGAVTYGPDGDASFEWGFLVTIDCWDGSTHEVEVWVDMGLLSSWPVTDSFEAELEGYAWNEIYDEAEAVVAQVCQPCGSQIVE